MNRPLRFVPTKRMRLRKNDIANKTGSQGIQCRFHNDCTANVKETFRFGFRNLSDVSLTLKVIFIL